MKEQNVGPPTQWLPGHGTFPIRNPGFLIMLSAPAFAENDYPSPTPRKRAGTPASGGVIRERDRCQRYLSAMVFHSSPPVEEEGGG
jgi:hypothetical protein